MRVTWREVRLAIVTATALVAAGCADRSAVVAPGIDEARSLQGPLGGPTVSVPAVQVELPHERRPWDDNDSALIAAVRAHDGYAVVGLKAPLSPRMLASGGLRAQVPAEALDRGLAMLADRRVEVVTIFRSFGAALVRMDPLLAPRLRSDPFVDYVEPRQVLDDGAVPRAKPAASGGAATSRSDALIGQTVPWGIGMVRAPEAWSVNTGTRGRIGVIGEVVEHHEDLPAVRCQNVGGRYSYECDYLFIGAKLISTFVAGIGVARDNAIGVVGVAPGVSPDSIYVWAACDPNVVCYIDDVAAGIDALRWVGVGVMHITRWHINYDLGEANAVAQAWGAGSILVADVGGNLGNKKTYPASLANVLGVGGVQPDKSFASTSPCPNGDGSMARSNYGMSVDLVAPFWALSTVGYNAYQDEHQGWCGSFVAAAHVVGAAALLRSYHPSWSNAQVVSQLLSTAEDLGATGWDSYFGYGLVDAAYALGIPRPPHWPPLSSVTIVGPASVRPGDTCTWLASATGGTPPLHYGWTVDSEPVGGDLDNLTYTAGSTPFSVGVAVTDSIGAFVQNSLSVTVSSQAPLCLM